MLIAYLQHVEVLPRIELKGPFLTYFKYKKVSDMKQAKYLTNEYMSQVGYKFDPKWNRNEKLTTSDLLIGFFEFYSQRY